VDFKIEDVCNKMLTQFRRKEEQKVLIIIIMIKTFINESAY